MTRTTWMEASNSLKLKRSRLNFQDSIALQFFNSVKNDISFDMRALCSGNTCEPEGFSSQLYMDGLVSSWIHNWGLWFLSVLNSVQWCIKQNKQCPGLHSKIAGVLWMFTSLIHLDIKIDVDPRVNPSFLLWLTPIFGADLFLNLSKWPW